MYQRSPIVIHRCTWLPVLLLVGTTLNGCTSAATEDHARRADEAPAGDGTSADGVPEISDLDRPAEELLASDCEHGIRQYCCDECRYEVGVAKVLPDLLAPAAALDTLVVSRRPVEQELELNGEVALDASRSVSISPRTTGIVRAIRVDVGSRVEEGDILLELDCADCSEARAQYLRSRAAREIARVHWERESDLSRRGIGTRQAEQEMRAALDAATADERAAKERLIGYGMDAADIEALEQGTLDAPGSLLAIRAPFAGTILERDVHLGALVSPGESLLLLGDTSRMWVMSGVYERELALLIERQSRGAADGDGAIAAEVTVPAYPDRSFPGRLDRLHGTLDETTRAATVRIVMDNPGDLLRAGMFARVRLLLSGMEPVVAVPAPAVMEDEGRAFVFTRALPDYFMRRPVETGRAWDGWVEITQGLYGGEVIVNRGAFLLKSDVLRSKMGAGCAD
jgi:membrane fusion protein, heavy metal efflux system